MSAPDEVVGRLCRRKGKFGGAFKPYMYAIRGCTLLEWRPEEDRQTVPPRHTYPLKGCFVEDGAAQVGKPLAFIYHAADGTTSHVFLADTKADKDRWKSAMLNAQVRVQERLHLNEPPLATANSDSSMDLNNSNSGSTNNVNVNVNVNVNNGHEGDAEDEPGGDRTAQDPAMLQLQQARQRAAQARRLGQRSTQPIRSESGKVGSDVASVGRPQRLDQLSIRTISTISFDFPDGLSDTASQQSGSTHHSRGPRIMPLLDSFADAVVVATAAGMVVAINSNAERMFGYKDYELAEQPVALLATPAQGMHRLFCTATEASQAHTLMALHKDGSSFNIEMSVRQLSTPDGNYLSSIRNLDEMTGTVAMEVPSPQQPMPPQQEQPMPQKQQQPAPQKQQQHPTPQKQQQHQQQQPASRNDSKNSATSSSASSDEDVDDPAALGDIVTREFSREWAAKILDAAFGQ